MHTHLNADHGILRISRGPDVTSSYTQAELGCGYWKSPSAHPELPSCSYVHRLENQEGFTPATPLCLSHRVPGTPRTLGLLVNELALINEPAWSHRSGRGGEPFLIPVTEGPGPCSERWRFELGCSPLA